MQGAVGYVRKSLAREVVRTVASVLIVAQSLPKEGRVLDCLTEDQLSFVLDNDPELVPPLLGYLEQVAALLHPCDRTERLRIGVAVNEALLNAIQHGNLELSSDLRQEDERNFHDLGEQRRRQPPYQNRRVRVCVRLTRTEAEYVIEDEGPGFDPDTVPDPTDPANLERIGGRGLMLMRTFMDEVEHSHGGNRITLRKKYRIAGCDGAEATEDS
jgi:anti-sigma regulatory factor (Ser/Thr protein kinase)